MMKHNKHQKQNKQNGNPSQVVTPYEDEDENSTEIIPRQIPMPTQLKKQQSTSVTAISSSDSNCRNCNDDNQNDQLITKSANKPTPMVNSNATNKGNTHNNAIEPPFISTSNKSNGRCYDGTTTRNSPFNIQHTHASEETRNYLTPSQITTPSCSNASSMLSIKTKLFDNSDIHYLTNSNNNFVTRVRTLLQTLTSMDLIPDQPMEWNRDNISSAVDDEEPNKHFLSLLFSMIEVVCNDQNNKNDTEIKSKATRMQLHGLLTIMENIVNLLLRSNQDVDYWKDQCRRNQISNDEVTGIHFQEQQQSNQCVQSSQIISLLQQENDTLRRQLMEIDATQLMDLQTQLTDKLMECQRLQEVLHCTEQERNHLMHLWKEKESTNTIIEKESRSLKSENETLLDENSHLHAEVIRLRLSIHHDYETRLKVSEENVQSLNIARNEILAQWNTAIKERTRLEGELGQCSRENSMIRQQLNYNQEEKTRLIRKIESLENLEQSRNIEIANSNRDKKRTLVELDILNQTIRKLQEENNHLVNELNAIKMSSDINSQKSFELEQNAAKTQYDAESFRNMASVLENEKHVMAASLEAERKKTKKLENIIQSIQTKENAASENIRKLVREKALLQTELNKANAWNIKTRSKRIDRESLTEAPLKSVACQSDPSNKLVSLSSMSISKKHHHVHQDNTCFQESEQKIKSSDVIENRKTDDVHHCKSCDKESTVDNEQDKENMEPCKGVDEIPLLRQSEINKTDKKTIDDDDSNKNLSLLDYLSQDTVSTIM